MVMNERVSLFEGFIFLFVFYVWCILLDFLKVSVLYFLNEFRLVIILKLKYLEY